MSTFRNGSLEKISLVSTFKKPYSAKMWPMFTFENKKPKIIFFVSTLLDWYKVGSEVAILSEVKQQYIRK